MSTPIKVLFVCAKNQWRSPTAAAIFRNDPRMRVQSAGLSKKSPQTINAKLLAWADVIMVMERSHTRRLRDQFRLKSDLPEIISLNIPDDYPFMDKRLVELLQTSVEEVLESLEQS